MEVSEKKEGKQSSRNVLAFFARHAKGQLRWLWLALFATLASIAATFLTPQVIRFTVDAVIGGKTDALPEYQKSGLAVLLAGSGNSWKTALVWCGAMVVVLSVLAGIFNFLSRMAVATGTERFCQNLRQRLFRHTQYLPFKWHVENLTGDIIQRCTSDLEMVNNFAGKQLLEVVRTLILVVVAAVLMLSMNVKLSLVALAFIPVISGYSILFYRLTGKRFLAADEAEGELMVNVQENLTAVRVVRAFGREQFELERFDGYNNNFTNLWLRLGKLMSINWGVGDIATGLQIFTVVLVGTLMAVKREITLGEFLVFVSYSQSLSWPIRALGRTLSEMSKTGVSAARIQEILDAEPEPAQPNAKTPSLRTDIRFEHVTFAYGNQQVLKDLSFTIKKGSTFGILGATGSGKSTITYLLNRLYDLPEGCGNIWFGDVELRQIDRYYLRKNVGLVLQEPFLFSKTIEENIAIAAGSTSHRQVCQAASVAAVDEAIQEFSHGYDTVVGERGVTLSGGQKQRVAIARTLMLNAPVMVFDDSMSAVDLETDARIRAALRENTGGATVILISHRINTLMHADQILVLEDGRLADMGTHAQLVARPGVYQRIYEMQSAAAADAGEQLETLGMALPEGGAALE